MRHAAFKCSDIGMSCGFEAKALTRGSLIKKIEAHAKAIHNLDPIPSGVMSKIDGAIR